MFYAVRLSVSVSEGTETKTVWAFEKKTDKGYLECKMTEQDIQDPDQFEFMLSKGFSRK